MSRVGPTRRIEAAVICARAFAPPLGSKALMAYDEVLGARVRRATAERAGISERKMFGGLAFMLEGHMFCGVIGDELMIRIGAERTAIALERPHTRPMDFTGRPLKGYVMVAPAGIESDEALRRWVDQAAEFAGSLPPKS